MNFIAINGSPSGKHGVTAQYMRFIEKQFPQHSFKTFEVAKNIKRLERDKDRFNLILQEIKASNAIIWCFPVYLMLIPAQLKRFIELLFERDGKSALTGKITTAISSSANFYDHTAHDYLHGVSTDLGCRYVRGFSPEISDLLSETKRKDFLGFANDFFWKVSNSAALQDIGWPPVQWAPPDLTQIPLPEPVAKSKNKNIVIISDAEPEDHYLQRMIAIFERSVSHPVDRIELRSLDIKNGCLGCMRCSNGGPCVQKDDYAAAFERLREADVAIYAGAVRDRYFSARFKQFIDRYFSNGHRPVLKAGTFGYLVSGPLNQLSPMRETLEANIQVGNHHRLGIVCDEYPDPQVTVEQVSSMAKGLEHWLEAPPWRVPKNFLGVGGHTIFRDLVYTYRGFMPADHRHYRSHGEYDFPQKNIRQRVINRVFLTLNSIPSMRKGLREGHKKGRVARYKKILE